MSSIIVKQDTIKFGDFGANICPSGSFKISEQAQCEVAADALGFRFDKTVEWGDRPGGCYENGQGFIYFNTHDGTGHNQIRPLCKAPSPINKAPTPLLTAVPTPQPT